MERTNGVIGIGQGRWTMMFVEVEVEGRKRAKR